MVGEDRVVSTSLLAVAAEIAMGRYVGELVTPTPEPRRPTPKKTRSPEWRRTKLRRERSCSICMRPIRRGGPALTRSGETRHPKCHRSTRAALAADRSRRSSRRVVEARSALADLHASGRAIPGVRLVTSRAEEPPPEEPLPAGM